MTYAEDDDSPEAREARAHDQLVTDMAKKLFDDMTRQGTGMVGLIGETETFNEIMELATANLFMNVFGQKFAQGCCEEHTGDVAIYNAMGAMAGEIIAMRDTFRQRLRNPAVRATLRAATEQLLKGTYSGRA